MSNEHMSTPEEWEMTVFYAALEIPDPTERQTFLDEACAGDPESRRIVEDLLGAQNDAEQFFFEIASDLTHHADDLADAAAAIVAAEAAGGANDPIFEEKPGAVFGPYRVVQKIGEGGCGTVYLAEQERPVRRRVALKVIKLGMDTKSVIARFEAERQALAIMDHPNIARVFDAGATDQGRPYFVMELVDGVKITSLCDEHCLGMEWRLELFIQTCQAIQHAHQKGIIHRDIKPSNVLVSIHDGAPMPKVIDFGIAKAMEERLTDKTIFTAQAQFIGTPAYMSPEQVDLGGVDLDTRSDIYSLGVLLYELLTGRTPFDSKELINSGVDGMRRILLEREPCAPSARLQTLSGEELAKTATQRSMDPAQLLSKLRGDLDWIVMKALEKDRERRYETANALAMDVRRHLMNEPVLARPPNRWYRLQKLVRRNRLVFVAGAAVVAALLVGMVVSTWLYLRERDAQRRALAAQRNAVVARQESSSRREAEMLGKVKRADLLMARNDCTAADNLLDGVTLEKPSTEAAVTLRKLGDWDATKSRWRQAAERFEVLVRADQEDSPDLVTIDYMKLGLALVNAGHLNNYERLRQEGISRYAGTGNSHADAFVKFSLVLPTNHQIIQDLMPQAKLLEKASAEADQRLSHDPIVDGWNALALALFEYRQGNYVKSVEWSRRCLANRGNVPPRDAQAKAVLSMARGQLNQMDEALWALIPARGMIDRKLKPQPGMKAGPEYPWHDWEFARILLHECEERFAETDRSMVQMNQFELSPERAAMFRALGQWHAVREEWREAADRYAALIKVNQLDNWNRATDDSLEYMIMLPEAGDVPGFFRLRDQSIARFKGREDRITAEKITLAVLIRQGDAKLLTVMAPLIEAVMRPYSSAEAGLEKDPSHQSWRAVIMALLEYRRGNYQGAADQSRRSFVTVSDYPNVVGHLVLAMSCHQLGQDAASRAEVKLAGDLIEGRLKGELDEQHLRNWLFARVLLTEAAHPAPVANPSVVPKAP
jgi:serine/threonine protein kinase/tetratricopeptide (TPR) repeat protein